MVIIHILNSMELYPLTVLIEVVRQKGFSAAAERLHSTQPTVSRIIRQLEDELGHPLLTRDKRQASLTAAGKIVHRRALALLAESARLRSELEDLKQLRLGELTLGIPPLGNMLFLPLVKAFKQRHPGVELRLLDGGSLTLEEALNRGRAELATLLKPINADQFDSLSIIRDQLVVVVPQDSPWARRSFLRLAELKSHPLILFPPGYALNQRIVAACQNAGFQPNIAGYNGQWQFILAMVQNGLGLALLPHSVAAGAAHLAAIPLRQPVIPWEMALAWPRAANLSQAAQALLELAPKCFPPLHA
jgi:DNA-binding transcriptional LysR family regulator